MRSDHCFSPIKSIFGKKTLSHLHRRSGLIATSCLSHGILDRWTLGPPTAEGSHAANPKINPWKIQFIISQCPFQEPIYWRYLPCRRPIFQAYVRGYPHKIWPDIWYSTSILGSWNSHWYCDESIEAKHLQLPPAVDVRNSGVCFLDVHPSY